MAYDIDPDWIRWISQSVIIHFKTKTSPIFMYVEGRLRPDPEPEPRFELRLDGPYFDQVSNGCWDIDVEINLLITSFRDETDAYKHDRLKGIAAAAFTDQIGVFKYGNGINDNKNVMLGCLIERSGEREKIVVSNFGLIEPTNRLIQSTVEAHYRMSFINERSN